MSKISKRIFLGLTKLSLSWQRDERGGTAVVMAFLMLPLMGALGLGFEVSNWYVTQRGMQNAVDAAVIAAAVNNGTNYAIEAKAVAAQYGFIDGSNNVTVTASNSAACPAGGNTCYSVSITGYVPLLLSQVLGFQGNTTLNGTFQKQLSSSAVATKANTPDKFCVLALGAQGIRSNGAPKGAMQCDVMSNANATCNGGILEAPIGVAHGTNSGCGVQQYSNAPVVADPYSGLASNIPTDTCSSYPQEPSKKNDPALPTSNELSGAKSWSGNIKMCGDIKLTSDVTIDAPAGAVLVIYNGQLDTNGYTLKTTNGSGLTVVFSGSNSGTYTHAPTGGGTLDIAAPTTGAWKGVAVYQDPILTNGVDIAAAGNTPAWDITGLVYLSNASVTLSGIVNKAGYGKSCFAMVVKDMTVNGTGEILPNGECIPAGLNMPTGTIPGQVQLVF